VSRASWAVDLKTRNTGQGKNTHDLCARSIVTKLANYPVTLYMVHFSRKIHAIISLLRASGLQTAPQHENKAARNATNLGVRPQTYPTIPTHRSSRTRNTTPLLNGELNFISVL
jgi:hypothetical protein